MAQAKFRRYTPKAYTFYSTAFIISLFAAYSIIKSTLSPQHQRDFLLLSRDLTIQDEECRLVHHAPDQCAFVRANCPDEEAGLISYLQLYYCTLPNLKPLAFTILAVWISLLFSTIGIAASDFLSINLSTISNILGMSESLAGVTFLAFGNGSPDVFSTFAAMKTNSGSLAVGELMGAAGFITAVVAGSMALVKPFKVAKRSFVRDVLFFAVAASFSLVFLADGQLRLWECVGMVAFYVFYVIFVVCWHWWIQRRRRIRLAEHTARSHLHIPNQQELEIPELEEDDEARPVSERTSLLDGPVAESLVGTPAWKAQEPEPDEDDEARNRALAELASNMRVSRPERGERRNTITPIRPSLIGALEFRSVLNHLEKKSLHSRPIYLRRYSDSPPFDVSSNREHNHHHPHHHHASQSIAIAEGAASDQAGQSTQLSPGRTRAVSVNDASSARLDSGRLGDHQGRTYSSSPVTPRLNTSVGPYVDSPQLLLSPGLMSQSGGSSPSSLHAVRNGLLAPPNENLLHPVYPSGRVAHSVSSVAVSSAPVTPGGDTPQLLVPASSVRSPQDHRSVLSPISRPASIRLPPASISPESTYSLPFLEPDEAQELVRYKWWPYHLLPPPQIIFATLFPTLYGWQDKSFVDRLLGVVTAPTVLLLTITLPIVEPSSEDNLPGPDPNLLSPNIAPTIVTIESPDSITFPSSATAGHHPHNALSRQGTDPGKSSKNVVESPSNLKAWNRWLVIVQLFTAPIFVVAILWANLDEGNGMLLLKMVLGSLACSLACLLILLLTTSADREPRYRPLLCFLGFAVAIAWISTIASEVVGVLKAFGVILNISDAILGLTIFAVGNSLGDLVADITVARLGYPVMALSACFGGPMLNILLGIGIGGIYMIITKATHKHKKHPGRPLSYMPYELDVSTSLMISGITLLVTLLGLLIFVPLNRWRMDRKVGIGLILLWSISTIANVILEMLNIDRKLEDWLSLLLRPNHG